MFNLLARISSPTPSSGQVSLFALGALLALTACVWQGCATARDGARGLFTFNPDARVAASWAGHPDALFPHLVEAARTVFADSKVYAVPSEHGIWFWYSDPVQGPLRAGFQLGARPAPDGKTITDLVVFPLWASVSGFQTPPRFPPHTALVSAIDRLGGFQRAAEPRAADEENRKQHFWFW